MYKKDNSVLNSSLRHALAVLDLLLIHFFHGLRTLSSCHPIHQFVLLTVLFLTLHLVCFFTCLDLERGEGSTGAPSSSSSPTKSRQVTERSTLSVSKFVMCETS